MEDDGSSQEEGRSAPICQTGHISWFGAVLAPDIESLGIADKGSTSPACRFLVAAAGIAWTLVRTTKRDGTMNRKQLHSLMWWAPAWPAWAGWLTEKQEQGYRIP